MKLTRFLSILVAAIVPFGLHAAPGATATLIPSNAYLLPGGGTATFTANVASYPGDTTAIGWEVTLPAGWSYMGGTGEPDVKPSAGQTGTLEWAYVSIPQDASFTFTAAYPSNLTSAASIASSVIVRFPGSRETITPTVVTLTPATAPVINNTNPAPATFGSTLSFNIDATSPIDIASYDATGLPPGLTRNGATISGAPTQTGSFTVTLKATNAAGTATKDITLTVNTANASIALSNLSHTYNGSPKTATATPTPTGLPVTITYDGNVTAPIKAGTYAVSATINNGTHTATASGTLTIARATPTITFADPGTVPPNQSVTLAASSTSGTPVTFTLLSGSATLTGSTLAINGTGSVVVRASIPETQNYEAAFADRTINSSKFTQSITFASLPDRLTTDGPFDLTATASSGLPVSFTIVSGSPAQLSGDTVTLLGTPGTVTIRASQPGNDTYQAAPNVTRSFEVTAVDDLVFFGSFFSSSSQPITRADGARILALTAGDTKVGDIAAVLPAHSDTGSLLIVAPSIGINELVTFTLDADDRFTATITQTAPTARTLTLRGQLNGTTLSGSIEGTGYSFTTQVEPPSGPSADASGLYRSSALETSQGTVYSIVGSNNNVLVLAVTPTLTVGGSATLASNGSFQLQASNVTLQGAVDASTTTVAGTIVIPNQNPIGFAGLETSTARTDRLVGLSSRGRVGSGEKILISGLVIGGSQPKQVLIRAIGPSLVPLGVTGVLADPQIRVFKGSTIVAENNDWGSNANPADIAAVAQRVGAFAVTTGSKDAILVTTLQPGAYTVHVSGGEGVALAEIYDASENPQAEYQRLIDISTRGEVGTGENVLIGGLVITGNSPKKVLIRGVGPGLAAQGVAAPLADPVLKVFRRSDEIATNDNWSTDATMAAAVTAAETATGAFHLQSGSKDAALLMTLAPGLYTVHVAGANNTTGVALVEIYEVAE